MMKKLDCQIQKEYFYKTTEESILYSKLFTNTQVRKVNRFGEDLCLFNVSEIERI